MRCLHCQKHRWILRRRLCERCYLDRGIRALYPNEVKTRAALMPRCLHCQVRAAGKPRGLCTQCYKNPVIRPLFATALVHHDPVDLVGMPRKGRKLGQPDPVPTLALPGSPEKVEVLILRARLGYSLFHPCDATLEGVVAVPLPAALAG